MDTTGRESFKAKEKAVTYFFSQFPKDHGAKEIYGIFTKYGNATEVVIPPKRDKIGRRFGFVRVKQVRDPR